MGSLAATPSGSSITPGGLEPCTIADARGCVPKAQSLSNGQVLMRDYGFDEVRVVLREMAWQSCLDLRQRELACDTMGLYVGHSGQAELFGHDGGQRGLGHQTAGERWLSMAGAYQPVTPRRCAGAVTRTRRRFGPNTVLSGTSLLPAANARERNLQIGGHRA